MFFKNIRNNCQVYCHFDLQPDWEDIENQFTDKTKAIVAVHYFGKPQKMETFAKFCLEKKILLIEDNAHGWGSKHNSVNLGELDDFGIISPRKVINIKSGGCLILKNKIDHEKILNDLKTESNFLNLWKLKSFLKNILKTMPFFYKLLKIFLIQQLHHHNNPEDNMNKQPLKLNLEPNLIVGIKFQPH